MALPRSKEPDQRVFLEFLYGVIVYEYSHITRNGSPVHHSLLTQAFESVVKTSTRYTSLLTCPCHELIQEYGLNTTETSAWPNMIANFELRLFPRIPNAKTAEDIYLGYKIAESGIIMPRWQPNHLRRFFRYYVANVPAEWKDDIAVIIYELRRELGMPGSGGKQISLLHGQLQGLSKFMRQPAEAKLTIQKPLVVEQPVATRQRKEKKEQQRKKKEALLGKVQAQERKGKEAAVGLTHSGEDIKGFRRRFIAFYYELMIFELMATYGAGAEVPDERIAKAFATALDVLEKNADVMITAAAQIREDGLDNGTRVREFFKVYQLQLFSASTTQASSSVTSSNGGYKISPTGVILPTWSAADERAFLIQYDASVPHTYKDDLAILVCELQNHLSFRGSGGETTPVHGRLLGVTKFKDLDVVKRAVFSQHDHDRRRRLEHQRSEQLEQSRLEQLDLQLEQKLRLELKEENEHDAPQEETGDREGDVQECLQNDKSQEHDTVKEEDGSWAAHSNILVKDSSQERLQEEFIRTPGEEGYATIKQVMDLTRKLGQPAQDNKGSLEGESRERHQDAAQTLDQIVQDQMNLLLNTTGTTEARKQQILDLRDKLTTVLSSYFQQDHLEILLFGSYGTGLSDKGSDAYFSVVNTDGSAIPISVDTLAKALRQLGFVNVKAISTARVPIVTFDDPLSVVACDISINQRHGALNSKLIDTYRQIDNRFTPLWFAIRQMARRNGILSGKKRYLTSYALVMMVITFLQTRPQPILPKLQMQPNMQRAELDGWDYSFDGHWSSHTGLGAANTETCATLLREFYRYFGYDFQYGIWEINPQVGAIRTKRDVSVATNVSERRKLANAKMCIMDPFIRDRNVAGSITKKNVGRIKDAFKRASDALVKGNLSGAFLYF